MSEPSVEERLAVLETRTAAIPKIETRVDEIWSWVNQQKGRESLAKFTIPGAALLISLAAWFRGG